MGLPFFVVVCWVFVAGDNSGFNLEQHMTRVEALAKDEKGLFIDLIAQHDGLAEELAQPEQEHKHIVQSNGKYSPLLTHMMNKRTAPPKRPWVGLTDEEIKDCMEMSIQKTCRAVGAKLKEKNT